MVPNMRTPSCASGPCFGVFHIPPIRGIAARVRLSFVRFERCPHITQTLSPDGPKPSRRDFSFCACLHEDWSEAVKEKWSSLPVRLCQIPLKSLKKNSAIYRNIAIALNGYCLPVSYPGIRSSAKVGVYATYEVRLNFLANT